MHIRRQSLEASIDLSSQHTIPVTDYRLGSWQIAISRRPRTKEDLARCYDAAARDWQRITRRYGLRAAYQRSLKASGVAAALDQIGSKAEVLDCGVGSGALAIALSGIVADRPNIHGIDLSSAMLDVAAVEMRHAGLRPYLRQADILAMPYADASFDLVMAAHVIEHLPDPQLALKEMMRVLKPGGMLFVCVVRRSGFGTFIQLRWRTWAIAQPQGIAWLKACQFESIGSQPANLGALAGQASLAFWARRPGTTGRLSEIDADREIGS